MERAVLDERTVYVVDDDAAVRRSLEWLLNAAGFHPVLFETAAAFLEARPTPTHSCVLIDIQMPGVDGLELQSRMLELGITLPVIMMAGQGDVQIAVRAMKAGAVDFIEKPFDDTVLFTAIEAAFTRASRSDRLSELEEASRRVAELSPREREVLDALMAGQSNKVIAFELGLSVRTVEVHRARMMDRLGVRQLAEAVRLAVMARLASERLRQAGGQ
jgi:two-component system response regulator FixJ